MAKKLVTSDLELITQVENVLKKDNIPCARIALSEESDLVMLVTINKYGEVMRNALKSIKTKSKYYFGVLRGHAAYTVPEHVLRVLSNGSSSKNH